MILLLVALSCSREAPIAPTENATDFEIDAEVVAEAIVAMSGWDGQGGERRENSAIAGSEFVRCMDREVITDDIVHYSFQVRVGPGEFDLIGVHRVVRERRPYRPIRTRMALMCQHGDLKDFKGMYLAGLNQPNTPDDFGMAVFLAEADVDVWGIDQGWTLVPAEVTDHAFMADWGVQRQVDDARTALGIARFVRAITGSGFRKMHFAGYSSGVWTGYALLNEESQLPPGRRHVDGYIPIDGLYKASEVWTAMMAEWALLYEDMLANGQFGDSNLFLILSELARSDPDGESPLLPGHTNWQAAIWFGIAQIFSPDVPTHYLAGIWEDGMPAGLQYLGVEEWFDFQQFAPPYEAVRFMADYSLITSSDETPFDDHLADITVPILNITCAGGIGPGELQYTTDLLGSTDVQEIYVQLHPDEDATLDFGHIDIFIAYNAPDLVWAPMLEWIEDHSP
jgi:hypothetical protein